MGDELTQHWTLLSSHGLVLVYLASQPRATVREAASSLGLSERRVVSIIHDLEAAGVVRSTRAGRRKWYEVDPNAQFRHPLVKHVKLQDVLKLMPIATAAGPFRWRA